MPLSLTVWDDTARANVREVGPFPTLQAAFDAVEDLEDACEEGEYVLLNGTDETGEKFDAYEPPRSSYAAEYRLDSMRDEADYRATAYSEARNMAGMAHGSRGLADYPGVTPMTTPIPDGYAATVDTRNFTFHGYGRTPTKALAVLRTTFEDHIEAYAPANPLQWSEIADGVRLTPIRFGQGEVS